MGNRPPWSLSLAEADAIARTWRFQHAQQRAACASFDDGAFDPTTRVEWIDFTWWPWPYSPEIFHSSLCKAKAMAVVWFALSCCSGFSEDEDAGFWYSANAIPREWWPGSITSCRFTSTANRVDRPFPRIRINPAKGYEEVTIVAFLGAVRPVRELSRGLKKVPASMFPENVRPNKNLRGVLARLKPFIDGERWKHQFVDIAIRGVDAKTLLGVLTGAQLQHGVSEGDEVWFELSAVYLGEEDESAVTALLKLVDVDVYIDDVLRYPRARQNAHSIQPKRHHWICRVLERDLWCSALPYSLLRDQLQMALQEYPTPGDFEIAWLGYALFHPEVAARGISSSNLRIPFGRFRESMIDTLKLMAMGNNLLYA